MEKKKKIKFNVISVMLCQIITVALGFLLPKLYLEDFGSNVNGVLSTVKQIFSYMCLLEAGIGLASAQALYKPIAESDRAGINSILSATSVYYRRTGTVYGVLALVLAVVYSFIIPTGMASHEVFTLIILNALPSLFAYFAEAKYLLLLEGDGLSYIVNASLITLQIVSGFAKIAVLLLTENLVLMQASYCILNITQYLFIYIYARRRYKWLDLSVRPDFDAISQRGSVLIHQVSALVANNTDIILISFFLDFKQVSIYYIYNLFFTQLQNFIASFIKSFTFALGQLYQTDRKRFLDCYSAYETVYIASCYYIYTMLALFLLPVIRLYTKGINDADYINPTLILLFSLIALIMNTKLPSTNLLEYSGEFRKTRMHAVAEMLTNLTLTLAAIPLFGICGALIGTLISAVLRCLLTVGYANEKMLGQSPLHTYLRAAVNGAIFGLAMVALGCTHYDGLGFSKLFVRALISAPLIFILFLAANALFFGKNLKYFIKLIKSKGGESRNESGI